MTKESSTKVPRQVEDLVQRSIKKIKMRDNVDFNQPCEDMEVSASCKEVLSEVTKTAYKDTLLTMVGSSGGEDPIDMEEISENNPNPTRIPRERIRKKGHLTLALPFQFLRNSLISGASHDAPPYL
ncbi:hypothetical protein AHAS_Ahas09G0081300 [Arachis hypogaea]